MPRYRKFLYAGHVLLALGLVTNVTDTSRPVVWLAAAAVCYLVAALGYVQADRSTVSDREGDA